MGEKGNPKPLAGGMRLPQQAWCLLGVVALVVFATTFIGAMFPATAVDSGDSGRPTMRGMKDSSAAGSKLLPVWSPRALGSPGQDIFTTCSPAICAEHTSNTPPSLWAEYRRLHMRVVYVINGGDAGRRELSRLVWAAVPNAAASLPVAVVATALTEETYPPTRKQMLLLQLFADKAPGDAVFVHMDTDAVVVPDRVLPLLQSIEVGASDVYLGRPISSCECNQRDKPCTYKRATHSCSGFFYVTTQATLRRIARSAFRPAPNGTAECLSSDLSVGYMMSTIGLQCGALRAPGSKDANNPGLTWPLAPNGKRVTVRLPICQQVGSPGGVHVQRTITQPGFMTSKHQNRCAIFHPAKSAHDVQYVWNLLHQGGDDAPLEDAVPGRQECSIGVLLPVRPENFDRRMAVRMSWARNARAYGVRVRFIIGVPRKEERLRGLEEMVAYENATYGDLVHSEHVEGYLQLPWKKVPAFALSHWMGCRYYASVDPDSYFRPYQALKMLEVQEAAYQEELAAASGGKLTAQAAPLPELYIGHIWDARKSGKPNVVHDPENPWYVGYKGDFYPPYASGYAYVLSATLAQRLHRCLAKDIRDGAEDVQIGICVHTVSGPHTRVVAAPEMNYNAPCSDATVADNPVCTAEPYNLLQRHEAHVRGDFCGLGTRRFSAGGRGYALSVGTFDVDAVSASKEARYLKLIKAPWERPPGRKPDIFVFQDVTGVLSGVYHLRSAAADTATAVFARGNRDKSVTVFNYQCLGCLGGWYVSLHATTGGKEAAVKPMGRSAQAVSVGTGGDAAFGLKRDLRQRFDVGVRRLCPTSSGIAGAKAFGAQLAPFKAWDVRLLVTTVGCGGQGNSAGLDKLAAALAAASGFGPKRVVVLPALAGLSHEEQDHAAASSLLHAKARPNAILLVVDSGCRLAPGLFMRTEAFVRQGVSAYFPSTFSHYDRSLTKRVETFYNRPLASELKGVWKEYEYVSYAMYGSDAKALHVAPGTMSANGGRDKFMQKLAAKQLHIIRMHEPGLEATYRRRQCDGLKGKPHRSCVASMPYAGSGLAFYLEAHEE